MAAGVQRQDAVGGRLDRGAQLGPARRQALLLVDQVGHVHAHADDAAGWRAGFVDAQPHVVMHPLQQRRHLLAARLAALLQPFGFAAARLRDAAARQGLPHQVLEGALALEVPQHVRVDLDQAAVVGDQAVLGVEDLDAGRQRVDRFLHRALRQPGAGLRARQRRHDRHRQQHRQRQRGHAHPGQPAVDRVAAEGDRQHDGLQAHQQRERQQRPGADFGGSVHRGARRRRRRHGKGWLILASPLRDEYRSTGGEAGSGDVPSLVGCHAL